jgi:hypothetical protein
MNEGIFMNLLLAVVVVSNAFLSHGEYAWEAFGLSMCIFTLIKGTELGNNRGLIYFSSKEHVIRVAWENESPGDYIRIIDAIAFDEDSGEERRNRELSVYR